MTTLNKITASFRGDPRNSSGKDVAERINQIIDILAAQAEEAEVTVFLESIGSNNTEARQRWLLDREGVMEIAARNQAKLEQALGTRNEVGEWVYNYSSVCHFNVVFGYGYFPILGHLIIPVGSGKFKGQGSYIRRKAVGVMPSIEEFASCLLPVGGSDKDAVLTQCGSTQVENFAIAGLLKDEEDGGNGLVIGHSPPIPENVSPTTPKSSQTYWAGQPCPFPQKRFYTPHVWSDMTSFTMDNGNGDSEIIVPHRGEYNTPEEVLEDLTIDIPLVRWVRAFDGSGNEIFRKANLSTPGVDSTGKKLSTTGRPFTKWSSDTGRRYPVATESKIYHKPIGENDTTTTVVVPGGLPADTVTVEVSFYNLKSFPSMQTQMTPYLEGKYYGYARGSYNTFKNIVCSHNKWNGFMLIDGAYNTFELCMGRYNGLDGWFLPGGYEDLMHLSFRSCGAVNNLGWGLYVGGVYRGSHNSLDRNKWPDADGNLDVHRKITYVANVNDFGNFDTYGNHGGAIHMGGKSCQMNAAGMEHHYDSNNINPFGTSSQKHMGDWNPLRWAALFVLTAKSNGNVFNVQTTGTDGRRVLFCKYDYPYQTSHPSNPDHQVWDALATNNITVPRQNVYAGNVEARTRSIHLLHLSGWNEQGRIGGDFQSSPQADNRELQGLFSGSTEYLFRPWKYSVTPASTAMADKWMVRFSVKSDRCPGLGQYVGLAADRIGINNQFVTTRVNFANLTAVIGKSNTDNTDTIVQPGQAYMLHFDDFDNVRDGKFKDIELENINCSLSLIEVDPTADDLKWRGDPVDHTYYGKLPEGIMMGNPVIKFSKSTNAAGRVFERIGATLYLQNVTAAPIQLADPFAPVYLRFNLKFEVAETDEMGGVDEDEKPYLPYNEYRYPAEG